MGTSGCTEKCPHPIYFDVEILWQTFSEKSTAVHILLETTCNIFCTRKTEYDIRSKPLTKMHYTSSHLQTYFILLSTGIHHAKKGMCDLLHQKVPYGPCYKLLVWYKYYSVISVQQFFQVKRFSIIGCKL